MLDFFKNECQTPTSDTLFGICDDDDNSVAYINNDSSNQNDWIAIVKNDNRQNLIFTAIDKCVIQDNEYQGRGRCDAMLTSTNHLYLIELKDKKPPWQTDTINQLESSIEFLIEFHGEKLSNFRHKKAFACNKKAPLFQRVDNELNLRFFREYGFRIDIQAEIVII